MYYHHLFNLIVLFFLLPSLVELLSINTDVLIIPKNARHGFVLLEETQPSRYHEFTQCLNQNSELDIIIDRKYGDLILNSRVNNQIFNTQQQLLCTINRNQVKKKKKFFFSFKCDLMKLFDVTLAQSTRKVELFCF